MARGSEEEERQEDEFGLTLKDFSVTFCQAKCGRYSEVERRWFGGHPRALKHNPCAAGPELGRKINTGASARCERQRCVSARN